MIEESNGTLSAVGVPTSPQDRGNNFPGLNDIYLPFTSGTDPHINGLQMGGGTANRNQVNIPQNGLDNILAVSDAGGSVDAIGNGNIAVPSNQFFLGAVLGGNAFGVLANMIDQLKGVDLLSAPKITVKNRNAGKVEIAREMRYPTNFQAPKFNGTPIQFDGLERTMLLPPTPSDFQTETIGVVLDVTPVAYPDRRIDLTLKPKVTDFEGFVNYGSNVLQGRTDGPSLLAQVQNIPGVGTIFQILPAPIVNPNPIVSQLGTYKLQQPVFNNRSVSTNIQVVDGQTVVMGGLVREDRSEIDDKVPLLGDLPLAGRLFRSKVTQTVKRNLVIFVTARLIRPTGKPKYMQDTGDTIIPTTTSAPTDTSSAAPAKNT
jgi:general secretion pathway protein D